jgi:hypothetical protein
MATPKTYVSVGKSVLSCVQSVKATRDAHLEVGRLVGGALSRAICEQPDSDGVADAVGRLMPTLQLSKIEGEDDTGALARWRRKALRYVGVHPDPEVRVDLPPLHDRLERWVVEATEQVGFDAVLDGVCCDGRPTSVAVLGTRFRHALRNELASDLSTPYRRLLFARLAADSWEREHRDRELHESAVALMISSGAIGALAGAATAVPIGATTVVAVAVGAGVAVITGAAGAVREAQRRITPEQDITRRAVRAWIWDLLATLTGDGQSAEPGSLAHPRIVGKLSEALRAEEKQAPLLAARPPATLVADLSGRLLPRSREAADQDVVFALIELEDALARWERAPDDRAGSARTGIYEPLRNLIDATRLPQEPA